MVLVLTIQPTPMAAKKTSDIAPEILARYGTLAASLSGVELKGVTMPYTAHRGNMFSFLAPDGSLNLRLSPEDRAEMMTEFQARQTVQHGVSMKEYVVVPKRVWEDDANLKHYFARSFAYAEGLKPKATKRG